MDIFENGHGGGWSGPVSSGTGSVGLCSWHPLYIKSPGVTNTSGLYDGQCGYLQKIPKALTMVQIVSRT